MDVLLFVKGLAQARDREAGGLGGVDDHLFAAREQGRSSRNLVDCIRRHEIADRAANARSILRAKTLSCWHQYLDECPPDETEVHAVSMACRTTVGSHR